MRLAIACCCALAALLGPAGNGLAGAPASLLRADVAEWNLVPSTGSIQAGRVHVVVRNLGAIPHQIELVRTRSFAQRLPLAGARAVTYPVTGAVVVAPGGHASFDVVLTRGSYLLLDNLPWTTGRGRRRRSACASRC